MGKPQPLYQEREIVGEYEIYRGERLGDPGWFYRHLTLCPGRDGDETLGGFASTLDAARQTARIFSRTGD